MHRVLFTHRHWFGWLLVITACGTANEWPTLLCAEDRVDRRFPYEAVIDLADEVVRSGPGSKYYPTDKLKKGTRVQVHRHDPGWVMIAPPEGSFSWIDATYVDRAADDTGTVLENGVAVWVGSTFGDVHEVYQRTLNKGDVVQVLGEKQLPSDTGPRLMYRIKPPAKEFRWVSVKAILPLETPRKPTPVADPPAMSPLSPSPSPRSPQPGDGPIARQPRRDTNPSPTITEDPFAESEPALANEPSSRDPLRLASDPANSTAAAGNASRSVASGDDVEEGKRLLDATDRDFRDMIRQEPGTWNLASVEQRYRQLQQDYRQPTLQTQVALRMQALDRYTRIKNDYDEFVKVATEAKQRDAMLMSLQKQNEALISGTPVGTSSSTNPSPSVIGAPPSSGNAPAPPPAVSPPTNGPSPAPAGAGAVIPPATGATNSPLGASSLSPNGPAEGLAMAEDPTKSAAASSAGTGKPGAPPRVFDGAGIIQKTANTIPGVPNFVLMSPSGRVLAYLKPIDGLDLTKHLGQAMGLHGDRSYRKELNNDLIVVRSLQPVQLRSTTPLASGTP